MKRRTFMRQAALMGMAAMVPWLQLPTAQAAGSQMTVWKYLGANYTLGSRMYPELFAQQMRYLWERGYKTLSLPEVNAFLQGASFPIKSTVLYMDADPDQETLDLLSRYPLQVIWKAEGEIPTDSRLVTLSPNTTLSAIRIFGKPDSVLMPILGDQKYTAVRAFGTYQAKYETPILQVNIGSPAETTLGEAHYLPDNCWNQALMQPRFIVIHTDGSGVTYPQNWSVARSWEYFRAKHYGVHFLVDEDDTWQTTPGYFSGTLWSPTLPLGGAFDMNHEAVSIEMVGNYYDRIVTGPASEQFKRIVMATTERTVALVVQLMRLTGVPYERVVGHYEYSIRSKSDPGRRYMDEYFRPLLLQALGR